MWGNEKDSYNVSVSKQNEIIITIDCRNRGG